MPTPEERQPMIERLRTFPDELESVVGSLTGAQLDATPIDEWSIRQIVHHCADSHMNSFIRFKLIITEDNPNLKPYDQEAWATLPDTQDVPVSASLQIIRGLHARWVALLESFGADQWTRTGFHPEMKENLTPDQLLEIYRDHCNNHLDQIRRVLAAQG